MSKANSRPHSVEIKICGITTLSDALDAIDCGADALGFNLYPGSKRVIEMEVAGEWLAAVPSSVRKVAVLVNPTREQALKTARSGLFDSLQLHGRESADFCRMLAEGGIAFTKAIPITNDASLAQPVQFFTKRVLLDSSSPRGFGGTGHTFPWSLARRFVEAHPDLQVTLAGGLTPENVAEAIVTVRPFGVDVTSGVEAKIGHKSRARLDAFIAAARDA